MEQKNKQILELSNKLLSRYKKNAGASASAADASGNLQKGNKRFSGIMKATRKQFSNDAKKSVAEAKDPREYDYEGDMAKSQLRSIIANAQSVHDMLEDTTNMAEWVQSKITLAADYISTVADYMQSEVNEAVTVKKVNHSWGKMVTVHHGSDTSYPLHPEHQQAIAKLGDGEKTTFKDETNSTVHAHREGDTVHLTRPRITDTKTSVAHSHFNEETEQGLAEGDKKPYPKTWHDVDPKLGKQVDKMSRAEQVKKGLAHPDTLKKSKEQGVAEAAKWRSHPDAYDADDEGNKTPRNPNSPKFGYDPLQRRADTANDAKTPRGKTAALKTSLKMAKGNKGVAEGTLSELNKDTLYSYAAKAEKDVDKRQKDINRHRKNNNPIDANKTMSKTMKRFDGMDRAKTRLNKEETGQGVAEASVKTLKSYLQKVSSDSMKHKADPTKRSPEKANRSVAGFAKAQNRLEKNVNKEWVKTGKTGTHIASGQKTFEWAKVNDKGDRTGERHYRNAAGKVMGEELEEGIKSKIAGIALSALAAHGAAHGRVTFDDEGGHSGGYKPTATATASTPSDNKPAAASSNGNTSGLSKEYLQRAADPNRFGRHMSFISPEKAAEHLKKMKEETVLETKGAPKGFHFTKDGKLKRGDADQDGNGGPMLRTDPLDKQRNKVPAVSEGTNNTFKSFRNQLAEKHLTPAEMKKREEVAKAMEREQPGMPMGKKMAIATATAKKAA